MRIQLLTAALLVAACGGETFTEGEAGGADGRSVDGGDRAAGGAGPGSGGASSGGTGGSASGGDSGSGGGSGGGSLVPADEYGLHGVAEDLGSGLLRFSYDFSSEEQLLDFPAAAACPPNARELISGALIVDSTPSGEVTGLKLVEFVRALRVTRLSFRARIEQGSHINAYVDLVNSGAWAPSTGLGIIHRSDGVITTQGGSVSEPLAFSPTAITGQPELLVWSKYTLELGGGSGTATLSVGETSASFATGTYFPTSRALGLGSWESVVAFDDLVIEGELDPLD
jgi:hypothetical protein